jgi:hypothetical protein
MLTLQDLTVGQVSGMIAAAVFIGIQSIRSLLFYANNGSKVQILIPMALPMILVGLLRLRSPAVTETAVSWYAHISEANCA